MSDPAVNIVPDGVAEGSQQFRSQVGHISRHSGVFFAGTIFAISIGYFFKIYLARVLGAETLGIYSLGVTLNGFVGVFNSLGLSESAVRFAAVYRATDKLRQLQALLSRGALVLIAANILFGAILLALGGTVARRFYHSPELARYIPWFAALMPLAATTTFYGRVLAGYKEVGRRTLITTFVGGPTTMLLSILLLSLGWGLRGYLLAQVLSALLVIALMLGYVWKLTPAEARPGWQWPPPLSREVWSFSAVAVSALLLEFLTAQFDKIALGFYRGARQVGIYSISAAVVAYVSLGLTSVNQVFSPVIADLHSRNDTAMLGRLYRALTKWILALTVPLATVVIVYARPLLRIFGHDFEAGWPVLIIGTAGQLVNCGVGSVGLLLWMSGNQRRWLKVQAVMTGFLIAVSIALIPVWGIIGAAVATSLTNAGTNFWNLMVVRKVLGFSPFSASFARLVVPSAASVLLVLGLKHEASMLGPDWLMIAVGLLGAYGAFAAVFAIFGLDSDDRLIADALWSRIRRSAPTFLGMQP